MVAAHSETITHPARPRCRVLAALALLFAAGAWAAPQDYVGLPVRAIRYEPTPHPLTPEQLTERVSVKTGQPLNLDDVAASIERLFASGRYEDIRVEAAREGDGVALTFVTRGASFIGQVFVEGVPEPPNQGQLVNVTKLELGTLYTEGGVRRATENVLELLRANGFYEATVDHETERDPATQQIDIRFRVTPGERARYARPVVRGNPIRTDDQIIKAGRFRKYLGLGGYKRVTETRTQGAVDRIRRSYQKDDRLLARVRLESMTFDEDTDTARPTLNIEAGPEVQIRTTGAKLSRGKLQTLVPVYQEQTVDRDLLLEGQRNIADYFQAQGYFDAEATFDIENPSPGRQLIEYDITRGERYRLRLLTIEGNRYFDADTIRERLYIQPATFLRYRNGRFSDELLRRDIAAIENLYRSNGFLNARVTRQVEENYRGKPRDVAVTLQIEEGTQAVVENLQLNGVAAERREELRALLTSIPGQPYSDVNVATDGDTLRNYYFDRGYADARVEVFAERTQDQNRFNVRFEVAEGGRQFVRGVVLTGLNTTRPALVREKISLEAGETLSQREMVESQRRLYDLGIFARVDAAIQNPDGDADRKFVVYRFEEARRYSVNVGFGAQIARLGGGGSTFNRFAPAGRGNFSPRGSFGVSRINFLGLGHTLSLQSRISNIEQRGFVTYLAPQFIGNDRLSLTLSAIYENSKNINTFTVRRREGSAQVSQRLSRANTAQYRLTYRQVSTSDVNITPQLIPLFAQSARIGLVSAAFIQDRRDDPVDPRRGMYNSIDTAWATKGLGSQTNFIRVLTRNSTYHRVGLGKETILARQLNFGLIRSFGRSFADVDEALGEGVGDVPLPERIFSGGGTTHRGFPENQAGPRDPTTGFPLGGKALLTHTTELRFPLIGDTIGGVVFHDMGNVFSRLSDISFRATQRELPPLQIGVPRYEYNYMVHAVGFGLRYRTPVGPVRVDLAYGLNSPRFYGCQGTIETLLTECDPDRPGGPSPEVFRQQRVSPFQFHFSLGQTF